MDRTGGANDQLTPSRLLPAGGQHRRQGKDTLENYGFKLLLQEFQIHFKTSCKPVAASRVVSDSFSKNRVDSLESAAAVGNKLAQSGPTLKNTICSAGEYQFTLCTLADLLFQK